MVTGNSTFLASEGCFRLQKYILVWLYQIYYFIKFEKQNRRRRKKKRRFVQKCQKWSLGLREVVLTSYDEIESCREWKVESSHMCKNSSRRTPRPKNLIFILCFNKKGRKTKKGDENSKNTYKSLSLFSTFRRTLSTKLLRPRSKDPLRFLYYGVKI